jgi:hypothetical protein
MKATPQTIESLVSLYRAVKDMRQWQRAYFRSRSSESLQRAKASEKDVDRIINELDNPNQPKQGELL